MPLETIDDTCFALRAQHNNPDILCTPSRAYRNFWCVCVVSVEDILLSKMLPFLRRINSIHEAILCEKTKGINGKLPVEPGPEL